LFNNINITSYSGFCIY